MPGSIRLFVPAPLAAGLSVALSAGQAHHLAHVMRRGVGDPVVLFNGRDGEWSGRLAALRRDRAIAEAETLRRPQRSGPDTWLVFAQLKRDATEWVVEKATELGVAALLPVVTAHTHATRLNLDRLRVIATEAAEQCERLDVPDIRAPTPLPDCLAGWPPARALVAAVERHPGATSRPLPTTGAAALLIGPEGGFSPGELDALNRTPDILLLSLGPRILRAETAAIAGLARLHAGRDD